MHRYVFLFWLLLWLPLTGLAGKWTPETLPMVHLKDARRYVCNPDGVLSQAAVDSTDMLLQALEKEKGVQTVVVVVKQLEGDDPYEFGMELARKYGIGSKQQNSGLIIILATEDRSYQILTGAGLEGTLPDAVCNRIERRVMVPLLKKEEWDKAIVATVKSLDSYIRGDESLHAALDEDDSEDELAGILLSMVFGGIFLFIVVMLVASGQTRCPQCKKAHLKVVKRQRVRMGNSPHWCIRSTLRCPRCGYEKNEYKDENDGLSGGVPPIILGGGRSGFSGGGSFGGGSFGGGFFGGGGSGGRF